MSKQSHTYVIPAILFMLISCGKGAKDSKGELNDKKTKLEALKSEQKKLTTDIAKLETEIGALDPSAAAVKPKLVVTSVLEPQAFTHAIDLQGKIDPQNVSYVAPRGQGGVIKSIHVQLGSYVKKGQLIMKLDDALARQTVNTAKQQIGGVQAQLELARSVYQRQQNLWKNNIGTEVQVLNAKTNVEALESQLRAAQSNVSTMQEQANLSNVYAETSGTIDMMNAKIGEFFSPQNASFGIRIVSAGALKIVVNVPESYVTQVKQGSAMQVILPEANNRIIDTRVEVVSKMIDPATRSFLVEARVAYDAALRPNQVALVKIQDYSTPSALTIPVNTLQNDDKGKFVLVAIQEGKQLVARKKSIQVGQLYGDRLEVKAGLQSGDLLITDGFQNLYDSQVITNK